MPGEWEASSSKTWRASKSGGARWYGTFSACPMWCGRPLFWGWMRSVVLVSARSRDAYRRHSRMGSHGYAYGDVKEELVEERGAAAVIVEAVWEVIRGRQSWVCTGWVLGGMAMKVEVESGEDKGIFLLCTTGKWDDEIADDRLPLRRFSSWLIALL
ncbi:hypothetical protein HPP92_020568 [Vanilla planifolia]|uniref:Uncharacterized protein n=1 Tax=Vanilla planifolia TaxID=51239 RepID=A0A835UIL8_VANPL|nr:hypothetical protein HPP92_020568 [Vanilla planifolia]